MRIRRLGLGNPGDVAPIGKGLSELRIDHGPGYRVYYRSFDASLIILLCAGTKRSQPADIERAKRIAAQWKD